MFGRSLNDEAEEETEDEVEAEAEAEAKASAVTVDSVLATALSHEPCDALFVPSRLINNQRRSWTRSDRTHRTSTNGDSGALR
ncbi:unnamed protein product [Soboliphyme baturini]|uniref:Uncharacterized protein n=1 Tax=Soboliphyme baturini TaxID=241478 RepID=A0A183IXQ5_9BILA|nr:unnamed protein product [Soboliphyme baturini]